MIVQAYKAFCGRHITKAIVMIGVSAIALVGSMILSHLRSDSGGEMMIHFVLMATAALLMVFGIGFLRKARHYRLKASEYAQIMGEIRKKSPAVVDRMSKENI